MPKDQYDFAGWVTKNDIRCADGVTIKHDAFKGSDGKKVPLVWNHDYNSPNNVLGHMVLHNKPTGVYGFGFFNQTTEATNAKEMIRHGDISSLSIGARKIKRSKTDIVHGKIYEVSLVLSGANPGAMIETVMNHSDDEDDEERGIIYPGTLIHSADDILTEEDEELEHKDEGGNDMAEETTIGEVLETMTDEQKEVVYALLGMAAGEDDEGGETMKQNVFSQDRQNGNNNEVLKHSMNDVLYHAQSTKAQSLKDVMAAYGEQDETIQHGINSIEMLFPETAHSTNGNAPILYKDPNTAYKAILNGTTKSPFSRVRTLVADLTEEEARAKGYIKGSMKKEQFFSLIKRTTGPATVYKKQKLDRDDIIDITDFDVVAFMNVEMRMMLEEEIARALLVGDGRDVGAEDKISEENIRPIITDNDFFTIKKSFTAADAFLEVVIKAMAEYRGSGRPDMFVDPNLLADIKLLKGTDNRYLFGDIPSDAAVAVRLGVGAIYATTFMIGKGALIVNLSDYTLGATKGGEITNFDDFDIDFNQYKYLIETRLSGSLTLPKSAIHIADTTPGVGADDDAAGISKGDRQADKL